MVSELGGSQISTLLETLPGIAQVLRSPVADAIVNLTRAAARMAEFRIADAEELVRYATRRSLLGHDEGERVLAEARAAEQRRQDKASDRVKAQAEKAKAAAKTAKPKPKPAAKKLVKPVRAVVKKKTKMVKSKKR